MSRFIGVLTLLLLCSCGEKEDSPAADQQTVQKGIDQSVADIQAAERAAQAQDAAR